ncbi:MAG: nascent polypeptide-associated complex protein [archaeon]|jgi:nascent polypeptide-associated complex subunit alpha|nr:nascent polypeptide-associated complex protein [archaeon]
MFGLGGGLDPKKMKAMMKQMGINQEDVPANRVVIEQDGKKIVISEPNVQKITMQGQTSYQISGVESEEAEGVREEDILMVAEKTGKSKAEAKKALEEAGGDIAEAIVKLS